MNWSFGNLLKFALRIPASRGCFVPSHWLLANIEAQVNKAGQNHQVSVETSFVSSCNLSQRNCKPFYFDINIICTLAEFVGRSPLSVCAWAFNHLIARDSWSRQTFRSNLAWALGGFMGCVLRSRIGKAEPTACQKTMLVPLKDTWGQDVHKTWWSEHVLSFPSFPKCSMQGVQKDYQ